MMDYLNPKRMPSPSSFIPQIEYAKVCSQLVPLLSIFRGCQGENPYTHLKEIEEIFSTLISRLECLHEPNENEAFFSSNFERQKQKPGLTHWGQRIYRPRMNFKLWRQEKCVMKYQR